METRPRNFLPNGGRLRQRGGFTLVEMMVAMAVLGILLVVAAQIITRTSSLWIYSKSKMSQGREARIAFNSIVSRLSQATVNSYYGYTFSETVLNSGSYFPNNYVRRSELRFISGPSATINTSIAKSPTHSVFFVAPLGIVSDATYSHLPSLLNVCGYYIEWSNVDPGLPSILSTTASPYRFRLMQFVQPAEQMSVYAQTIPTPPTPAASPVPGPSLAGGGSGNFPGYSFVTTSPSWQKSAMTNSSAANVHLLANNVIALFFLPLRRNAEINTTDNALIAPGFVYNSETDNGQPATSAINRTPPLVRVVMYTIDEKSALRLTQSAAIPNLYVDTSNNPLFTNPAKLFPSITTSDIGDLARFEKTLTANRLTFRRFDAAVELPRQPWNTRN